jgi:hypothetical protein
MTDESNARALMAGAVVAFVAIVLISFFFGRCSAPDPTPLFVNDGIDAGPGEISIGAELDAAIQTEVERLRALEREHADELETFTEAERREYEATRARGRDALALWFKRRFRALLDGGGA